MSSQITKIDEKCKTCKYSGRCLYENTEFVGIKVSACCDLTLLEEIR